MVRVLPWSTVNPERMEFRHRHAALVTTYGGLHQQRPGADILNLLQREERMTEVIEHSIKQDEIECAERLCAQLVNTGLERLRPRVQRCSTDIELAHHRWIVFDPDDFVRPSAFSFKSKKSFRVTDIKDAHPSQVIRETEMRKFL